MARVPNESATRTRARPDCLSRPAPELRFPHRDVCARCRPSPSRSRQSGIAGPAPRREIRLLAGGSMVARRPTNCGTGSSNWQTSTWHTSTRRGAGAGKPVGSEPAASDSPRLATSSDLPSFGSPPTNRFPAGATVRVQSGKVARWAAVAPAVGPVTGRWARHLSGVWWRS